MILCDLSLPLQCALPPLLPGQELHHVRPCGKSPHHAPSNPTMGEAHQNQILTPAVNSDIRFVWLPPHITESLLIYQDIVWFNAGVLIVELSEKGTTETPLGVGGRD